MVSRKNDKYIKGRRGKLITLLIASFVLLLSVGYTALNEELTISGEAHFRVEEDIRVTGINILQTTNSSIEDYNPTYGKDSIKVGVTLPSNQSTVTYKVKIANYSNVAMKIAKIEKLVTNNNYAITFNKALPLTIGKLSEEEIEITFKNNTSASQVVESTLQFTFEKLESMMTTGNANASTSTFYRGPIAKNTVSSITFMSTKEIPEDAVGYWDASKVQGTNEVIAYYLNSETEGMYDLYIAADGEVYAPNDTSYLFNRFTKMKSLNFNNAFNSATVTSMKSMFAYCESLMSLELSNFNTGYVDSMFDAFTNVKNVKVLDLRGVKLNNSTKSFKDVFFGAAQLTNVYFADYSNIYNITSMENMFRGCSKLQNIDLSKFNTKNVTTTSGIFSGCTSLSDLNLSGWTNDKLTSMASMFNGLTNLETLNLTNFKTDSITNMTSMFYNCKKLVNLDLSSFDMSSVKNFDQFMYGCTNLSNLVFPDEINTTSAESFYRMFYGCRYLSSLDLSKFNTSNATNMKQMFYYCERLSNLNVSNFDTENVTNMSEMFALCYALNELDISSFTISDNTNISYLFQADRNLKNINISSMDFENKTINTTDMFTNVPSGVNIYVLNDYNKTFIKNLKSDANVIIYVSS